MSANSPGADEHEGSDSGVAVATAAPRPGGLALVVAILLLAFVAMAAAH